MSGQDRDDGVLKQFKARAQAKPNGPKPPAYQQQPQINVVVDCGQFGGSIDTDRWIHVGTSPKISQCDVSQARRRLQTFMADS